MRARFTRITACTLATFTSMTAASAQLSTFQPTQAQPLPRYSLRSAAQAAKDPAQAALDQVKKAKTDAERQAAQSQLDEALGNLFDEDIERRKAELAAIRQRLEQMQTMLQKRVENKDRIIALRVQVLASQAEGLGWAGGSGPRRPGPAYNTGWAPAVAESPFTPPPAFVPAPPAAAPTSGNR